MDVRMSDRTRQAVVAVSTVLALALAAIGSGAFIGTPIQDAAGGALDADSTLLAPGRGAFQIWGVIYLGLVAYGLYQALPGQAARERHRRIGWWAAASMLLNAAWILVVQAGLLALSVPVIALLLAVLVVIVLRLGPPASIVDRVVGDGTFGLYLGWVTIATVANVTALLQYRGFAGFGLAPEAWALVVLLVAAAIGVGTAVRDGARFTPAIALAWGLAWIAVARSTAEPQSAPVAVAAGVAAAVVLLAPIVLRLRRATARSRRPALV
ncbi:tryptophan-rich sensory protein [Amnibacterium endophyticum]|uniref:Tryptophan-rich sensory protein n=1 Tax=Amnibacterium endophyticum TaxID=2109337 RepID=A0ABW4LEE5_9MICO